MAAATPPPPSDSGSPHYSDSSARSAAVGSANTAITRAMGGASRNEVVAYLHTLSYLHRLTSIHINCPPASFIPTAAEL